MMPNGWLLQPVAVRRPWGDGEVAGEGWPVGEWWLASDHPHALTRVVGGPDHGRTLTEVAARYGADFWGRCPPAPRFPVLLKLLQSRYPLPLQVHPITHERKHEAWVIQQSRPDAWVALGWRHSRRRLLAELRHPPPYSELGIWPVRPGWTYLVPAGVPHALGPGIRAIEVQETADVTIRIDRWGMPWPDLPCDPEAAWAEFQQCRLAPAAWPYLPPMVRLGHWGMAYRAGASLALRPQRPLLVLPSQRTSWRLAWPAGRRLAVPAGHAVLLAPGPAVGAAGATPGWLVAWPDVDGAPAPAGVWPPAGPEPEPPAAEAGEGVSGVFEIVPPIA